MSVLQHWRTSEYNISVIIHLSIRSQRKAILPVAAYLQGRIDQFCQVHHLTPVDIGVCLQEALANAVIHGNLEVPSALKEQSWEEFDELVQARETIPEFADRRVMIRCQLTTAYLLIVVEDQGRGFDPGNGQPDDSCNVLTKKEQDASKMLSKSGRGLFIIRSLMDDVDWNETGNRITMVKHFPAS